MALNDLPKQFRSLGIRMPVIQKRRRLVLEVDADTKVGKTRLIFTMPKPLLFINIDLNSEGQEGEIVESGDSGVYIFDVKIPDEVDGPHDLELFKKCRKMVYDAVETKFFRSVAIDTGDALWDLCQRGFFGKTGFGAGGMQSNYSVPNGAMARIFKTVRESHDVNFMVTQRVKEERESFINEKGKKDSRTTGRLIASGWKHTKYEVHAVVKLDKDASYECDKPACQGKAGCTAPQKHDPNRYSATITDSQFGGERTVLRGKDITFKNIALSVHPITEETPEVWD
jgi:hypothetical protein